MLTRMILFQICLWCLLNALHAEEPALQQLLQLHTDEASRYRIAIDEPQTDLLDFQSKPVFAWTNPVGDGVQTGHIFLWTKNSRPEAIGTIFSLVNSENGKRALVHEFHTLSPGMLYPEQAAEASEIWRPAKPLEFQEIQDTEAPEESLTSRLRQMRSIARSVSARTIDGTGMTRELRLLTTPLSRYAPTAGAVTDGAIFAMVSSDGTDPELLLVIEAFKKESDQRPEWRFATARFSDRDLAVERNGTLVWSSQQDRSRRVIIAKNYRLLFTEDRDYMCFRAREIDELPPTDQK